MKIPDGPTGIKKLAGEFGYCFVEIFEDFPTCAVQVLSGSTYRQVRVDAACLTENQYQVLKNQIQSLVDSQQPDRNPWIVVVQRGDSSETIALKLKSREQYSVVTHAHAGVREPIFIALSNSNVYEDQTVGKTVV